MSNPQHHQSARRALRLQWILQGHAFDGLRLKQVAEALQVTPPMALRDLQLLADEGIAERIPGKEECWLVLDAEPDARLAIGFERDVTPEDIAAAALDGTAPAPTSATSSTVVPTRRRRRVVIGSRLLRVSG